MARTSTSAAALPASPATAPARVPIADTPNLYLFSIDYEDVRGELVGGWRNADRLPDTTARFLRFLHAHDVTATFFVSGETARAHPDLIRKIISAGHEKRDRKASCRERV